MVDQVARKEGAVKRVGATGVMGMKAVMARMVATLGVAVNMEGLVADRMVMVG